MNMRSPSTAQLSAMLRECDDKVGHHVAWVDSSGEVHISTLVNQSAGEFQKAHPSMRLRLETLCEGNGYVGPSAAEDADWVRFLLSVLLHFWPISQRSNRCLYADEVPA